MRKKVKPKRNFTIKKIKKKKRNERKRNTGKRITKGKNDK